MSPAILMVVGAAACSGSAAAPEAGSTTGSTPEKSPAATTSNIGPTTTPESSPPPGPITIAFAGDVHFEAQLRSRLEDPATALAPIATQLSAADLTVVNLETSIGTSGSPEPKRFTFQAPPEAFDALAAAGVDVATMANNHGMDFGPDGLDDTLTAIAADPPLEVIGIGSNADQAFAPAVVDVRGTTVAVIGAHSADDPRADPTEHWAAGTDKPGVAVASDPGRLVAAVRDAARAADLVVVFMHWGVQGERCPSRSQVGTARALSDAGASIVVGSHAHVVQGTGLVDATYVAYGLGNFVWYNPDSESASTTGLLTITVDAGHVVAEDWNPARIDANGMPRFVTGGESEDMAASFASLRQCTDLAPL
ncbi:MAG TPA: CapA family protein [Jiangellaceae bacterium]|jgi:poly-gamma-glutamate capsule biosynthesis protein CapA/YwtB (metallophosphatase superfamily)|nr:CapA family protein [Jiangellaceae bacterium]